MIAEITVADYPNLVGQRIDTDLIQPIRLSGVGKFEIKARAHLGNGVWRLWGDESVIEIKEDET